MSNIYLHPISAASLCRVAIVQINTGMIAVIHGRHVKLEKPEQTRRTSEGWQPMRRTKP